MFLSIRVGLRAMARVIGVVDLCPEDIELVSVISSAYNLCSSVAFETIVVSLSSAYNLCVPKEESLTVSLSSAYNLCVLGEEALTVSPTSTYSLATAVT